MADEGTVTSPGSTRSKWASTRQRVAREAEEEEIRAAEAQREAKRVNEREKEVAERVKRMAKNSEKEKGRKGKSARQRIVAVLERHNRKQASALNPSRFWAAYRERTMLISLFIFDILISAVFLGIEAADEARPTSPSTQGSNPDPNATLRSIQLLLSTFTVVLNVVSLAVLYRALAVRAVHSLAMAGAIKFLLLFSHVVNLENLAEGRLVYIALQFASQVAEIVFIIYLINRSARHATLHETDQTLDKHLGHDASDVDVSWLYGQLRLLDSWLTIRRLRSTYKDAMDTGRNYFLVVSGIVLGLALLLFVYEFQRVVSTQPPYYSDEVATAMNENKLLVQPFGVHTLNHDLGLRVVLMLWDGLRYDHAVMPGEDGSLPPDAVANDLTDWLHENRQHLLHMKMRARLPSMSVPNWLTLLTGSSPEITGVLGNLLVPETSYDSLFRQTKRYNMQAGVTASPWMSNIIKSQLPLLNGDGTVAADLDANGKATSSPADRVRSAVLNEALGVTEDPYRFFLAHFSDIDGQGHAFGVTDEYNRPNQNTFVTVDSEGNEKQQLDDKGRPVNSYLEAIAEKTAFLRDAVDRMDNDTVVFIVSDHGHVDRGGHGGVSTYLTHVPLVMFQKNSFIANATLDAAVAADTRFAPATAPADSDEAQALGGVPMYNNTDVAPTIAALLGLPVPRQAEGVIIPDALLFLQQRAPSLGAFRDLVRYAFADLFYQKQQLTKRFIEVSSVGTTLLQESIDAADPAFSEPTVPLANMTYVPGPNVTRAMIEHTLLPAYAEHRTTAYAVLVARNVTLTLIVEVLLVAMVLFVMQSYTFTDPGLLLRDAHEKTSRDQRSNRLALAAALTLLVLYYTVSILMFLAIYDSVGYAPRNWDSTLIHTPAVIPRYLIATLVPGIIVTYLMHRAYNVVYTDFDEGLENETSRRRIKRWLSNLSMVFSSQDAIYDDPNGMVYLVHYYLLFLTIIVGLVLFSLQATFSFIVPLVFRIPFIESSQWALRFRVLTGSLISMPLILGNMYEFVFRPEPSIGSHTVDPVYRLKVRKDERALQRALLRRQQIRAQLNRQLELGQPVASARMLDIHGQEASEVLQADYENHLKFAREHLDEKWAEVFVGIRHAFDFFKNPVYASGDAVGLSEVRTRSPMKQRGAGVADTAPTLAPARLHAAAGSSGARNKRTGRSGNQRGSKDVKSE